jgi:hypothetical protein
MSAYLICYDSNRPYSVAAAAACQSKYPNAVIKDVTGYSPSDWNTYIGTIGAAAYDKIMVCVNSLRLEEVHASCNFAITAGAAADAGYVNVDDGVNSYTLGAFLSAAGGNAADATLLRDSINLNSVYHGYTAGGATHHVIVYPPDGVGVAGNGYVGHGEAHGATLVIDNTGTDFADLLTGVTAIGVAGDITEEDFIDLEAKIVAVPLHTGTARVSAAGTVLLEVATASTVDDAYNGMMILLTGGTGADRCRKIINYNGTTQVATVDTNWEVADIPDATTTYVITNDLQNFGRAINYGAGAVPNYIDAWDKAFPGHTYPLIFAYLNNAYNIDSGTETAHTATTLTDGGKAWTPDALIGDWIGIYDGTGKNQTREITDNDGDTVTVRTWDTHPSTDSLYVIAHTEFDLFKKFESQFAIMYRLNNLSLPQTIEDWAKLLNWNKTVDETGDVTALQDIDFLYELTDIGKVAVLGLSSFTNIIDTP